ncbi:MAG: cytochrome b5-like heme/steroid binding domain-containing protein [Patescibacteria group bacterium]|jgi:cytochrome b involved in lipid metabolism|nr:cytochrome b5-like heme/steroid binding domain-containing protein [Patescibacteria group bacterium]
MKIIVATLALSLVLVGCTAESQNLNTSANNPADSGNQAAVIDQTYTIDQVVQANSADRCWTIVDGKVYDITSFIDRHPGGVEKIQQTCGRDATDLFQNKHGGQPQPKETLASLQIGSLQ